MAEFLVRIKDKTSSDPYLDAQCLKRGDIVAIQPDGWGWGLDEINNPDWRILKFPMISIKNSSSFIAPEFNTDPANPSYVLRRRAFSINLNNPIFKNVLKDKSNNLFWVSEEEILALKIGKDRLKDPNVLD